MKCICLESTAFARYACSAPDNSYQAVVLASWHGMLVPVCVISHMRGCNHIYIHTYVCMYVWQKPWVAERPKISIKTEARIIKDWMVKE